jgi:hypothetical protein
LRPVKGSATVNCCDKNFSIFLALSTVCLSSSESSSIRVLSANMRKLIFFQQNSLSLKQKNRYF